MINLGDYLSLINDWEVNNPLPTPPVIIYSKVVKPIKLVKQPVIKSKAIPNKINNPLSAKELVNVIESKALSIGWTLLQLEKLITTVANFIPCSLELVGTRSININMVHSDGSIRGSVVFRK